MAADRITGKPFATRSEVIAQHGMAATSQPLATQIALEILKKGGSAVDAAIAANAALGLMEPTGNGMGGDLFAIVWDAKTQKLHGLNASGRSPMSLTLEEFRKRDLDSIPPYGVMPITPQLREAILDRASTTELRRIAHQQGMMSLREDGLLKVAKKVTTVEEVLRETAVAD